MKEHEFFRDESGCILPRIYDLRDPEVRCFDHIDEKEILEIFDHLCQFSEARKALLHLMSFCNSNRKDALKQFILCNWTGLDDVNDITPDRLNYEFIPCKHKGKNTCPYNGEGIVCQRSTIVPSNLVGEPFS